MKQRVLVALLTVLVFAAGFAARMWTESDRPLPPPPAALMSEVLGTQPAEKKSQNAPKPYNRAQLVADIGKGAVMRKLRFDAFEPFQGLVAVEGEVDLPGARRQGSERALAGLLSLRLFHLDGAAGFFPGPETTFDMTDRFEAHLLNRLRR